LGKGQGHEDGECDVARRVCEYDLDETLMGAECLVRAGAGAGAGAEFSWCAFGVGSGTRTPCLLGLGTNVEHEGHVCSASATVPLDTSADQLGFKV
jgi:hypothetical protein